MRTLLANDDFYAGLSLTELDDDLNIVKRLSSTSISQGGLLE